MNRISDLFTRQLNDRHYLGHSCACGKRVARGEDGKDRAGVDEPGPQKTQISRTGFRRRSVRIFT